MAASSPTSLIDRAGLDSAQVGRHLDRALEGADDGELASRSGTQDVDGGSRRSLRSAGMTVTL